MWSGSTCKDDADTQKEAEAGDEEPRPVAFGALGQSCLYPSHTLTLPATRQRESLSAQLSQSTSGWVLPLGTLTFLTHTWNELLFDIINPLG